MAEPQLRLRWRKTWPDVEGDFVALDRRMCGETVGRVYQHSSGGMLKGQWFWSLTAYGRDIVRPAECQGYEPTTREAAAKVEAAWFKAIEDIPEDTVDGALGRP